MSVFAGPETVTSGLLISLDAGNPRSYPGSGTTLFDSSDNKNNATLTNGVTYNSSENGSLVFDGTDDRCSVASTTQNINNQTWEAWVNRTQSVNSYNMFMGKQLPYFGILSDNSIILSNLIGGSQRTMYSTGFAAADNTWYHLVFTAEYDGANTVEKIYINGILNNTATFAGQQTDYSPPRAFTIGDGRETATWYPFKGKISSARVYTKTLSAAEVSQNFNALRGRYGI